VKRYLIAGLLVALLAVFFSRTKAGRALRAVADDHAAAQSIGRAGTAGAARVAGCAGGFAQIRAR